jgi:hypothetical protein
LSGSPEEAEAHSDEAIRLAKDSGIRQEMAYATMVKGMIAAQKQAWVQALEHYEHATRIFEELGDRYNTGRVNAEMAVMHIRRNQDQDRERAREYVAKARATFSALGARTDLEKLPDV